MMTHLLTPVIAAVLCCGDSRWAVRDRAERFLHDVTGVAGWVVSPILGFGMMHGDVEIKRRCERVLNEYRTLRFDDPALWRISCGGGMDHATWSRLYYRAVGREFDVQNIMPSEDESEKMVALWIDDMWKRWYPQWYMRWYLGRYR